MPASRPLRVRFEEKFERRGPDECWPWTAGVSSSGYGMVRDAHSRVVSAHRVSYELYVGEIPPDHEVDHVAARGCTTKLCVNPRHLEPVLHVENMRRWGETVEVCVNGHPYTPENTMLRKRGRTCRQCHRDRLTERRGRASAARQAA